MASSDIAWREGTDGLDVTSHLAARLRQMPKPVAAPAAKAEACAHTYATVRRLGLADPGRRPTARDRKRLQLAGWSRLRFPRPTALCFVPMPNEKYNPTRKPSSR